MNKKSFLSLLLVSSICLVSCKKDLEPQESSATPETPAAEAAAPQIETTQDMQQNVATPAAMPQQVSTPQPAQTAPGMNPPHGQPNHRCEIAVGAPLNSAAAPKAVSQSTPAATITPSTPSQTIKVGNPPAGAPAILNPNTATTTTAPGMNPPHGQDGHRCDIAVGAPLNK